MTRFNSDLALGKQSEIDSHKDLQAIFGCKLIHDEYEFAHFDFFNDNIFVELKTRPNTEYINGKFIHTKDKDKPEETKELNTLLFDCPKMRFGFQYNLKMKQQKKEHKKYYIVWKCSNKYFYWEINWDKKEYYTEATEQDYSKGCREARDVCNVYVENVIEVQFI